MTTVTVLCCVALYMCSLPCLAYLQGKSYHITEYFTVLKSRYFLLIVLLQFAFFRLIKTAGKRRETTQKQIDKHTLQEGVKKTLTAKISVFFCVFTDKP